MKACPTEPNEVPVIVMIRPPLKNSNQKIKKLFEKLSENVKLKLIKYTVITTPGTEILKSS